jgi:hypothetical protein
MKQPKIAMIPLLEDLASTPSQSQLQELEELERQGKIKIWPDGRRKTPDNRWMVVVYEEVEGNE